MLSRMALARVLLYGGLVLTFAVCVLLLQDPNRADQIVWRVVGIAAALTWFMGMMLFVPQRARR